MTICLSFNAFAAKKHRYTKPVVLSLAPSIMLVNQSTHTVIVEENSTTVRPLASITKLMTAMVVLDQPHNMDVKVSNKKTVGELFTLMLVRSDNAAAETLSRTFLGNRNKFIAAMNQKAHELGMESTSFSDPTGLLSANQSTAADIVKLVTAAGNYPAIRNAASLAQTDISVWKGKQLQHVIVRNTNYRILQDFNNIVISKTGFINLAGRCLTLLVEQHGEQFAVVVLGEPNVPAREATIRALLHTHLQLTTK